MERLIRVAEPGLSLVLAVGDRIARVSSRGESPEPLAPPPAPDGPVRQALRTGR